MAGLVAGATLANAAAAAKPAVALASMRRVKRGSTRVVSW
jgi:hypothetical protein